MLVPDVAPSLAAQVPDLSEAVEAAVGRLAAADHILILTSGPGTRDLPGADRVTVIHPPGTAVSAASVTAGRGSAFSTRLSDGHHDVGSLPTLVLQPGAPSDSERLAGPARHPGVGVVVGAALLVSAGICVSTTAIELAGSPPTEQVHRQARRWLAEASASADSVGVLLVAQGSAGRGAQSPSGGHQDAAAFDDRLADAFAQGDPCALADAVAAASSVTATAQDLLFVSGPAFTAFAQLTRHHPPAAADLAYRGAPFGVAYLVGSWQWGGDGGA